MRKLFTLLVAVLLTASVFAQAPEKMSYQAVIRNTGGTLVASTQIGMEINIRQGSETGTVVYTETQTPTTNANGLVSIEIGGGAGFSTINWANDDYFIETKTAVVAPLTTYTITGVSQLLSVPYALNAKTADNGITTAQADAITANTAKVGITTAQADEIAVNTAKVGYTDALVSANADVVANTAKVGITTAQADAITANTAKVGITGAQTTKLAGIADGAEVNVQADWNQATITADDFIKNKPTIPTAADGSETKVTAGTNVTVTGSGTTASPYVVNATAGSGSTTFSVGDFAQGGIVFWVDETGQHGLVAAKEDQSTGVRWYAGTYGNTQAKGDGPFSGEANTSIIIAAQVAIGDDGSTYAARICNELQVTEGGKTYGDWYLPSKEELNLMYQNKATIDATAGVNGGSGFASASYWSSTEYNNNFAWLQSFVNGFQNYVYKYYTYYVRAIRAF